MFLLLWKFTTAEIYNKTYMKYYKVFLFGMQLTLLCYYADYHMK